MKRLDDCSPWRSLKKKKKGKPIQTIFRAEKKSLLTPYTNLHVHLISNKLVDKLIHKPNHIVIWTQWLHGKNTSQLLKDNLVLAFSDFLTRVRKADILISSDHINLWLILNLSIFEILVILQFSCHSYINITC